MQRGLQHGVELAGLEVEVAVEDEVGGGDDVAVDGAVGAAFLKTLKGLLEDPVRILI